MQEHPPINRRRAEPGSRANYVVPVIVLLFFGVIGMAAYAVTGFFRLSHDTASLRDCLLEAVPGGAQNKITVNVGLLTTGFVRLGSRFFDIPPEARSALEAFRSGEVGIYRLGAPLLKSEQAKVIREADKSMAWRGWTRIVGVAEKDGLVIVYVPAKGLSMARIKCCVMVVNDSELVLVAARANLNPLASLARNRLDLHQHLEEIAAVGLR